MNRLVYSHIKGDLYKLKPAAPDVIEELIQRYEPATATSRTDASFKGDSHSLRTSVAYLVAKRLNSPNELLAIGCKAASVVPERRNSSPNTTAVLIENSECFTYNKTCLNNLGLTKSLTNISLSYRQLTHQKRYLSHCRTDWNDNHAARCGSSYA